jgi:hypothetical protein
MATEEEEKGFTNFSISIQSDLLSLLDRVASEKKMNRSQFIRGCFGEYLRNMTRKFTAPQAGIYTDVEGNPVHIGLLDDLGKSKVASGEWRLVKEF